MAENDGRSTEEKAVTETVVQIDSIKREYERAKAEGRKAALADERRRISEIDALFQLPSVPRTEFMRALRDKAIDDGWTVDLARKTVLEGMAGDMPPDLSVDADDGYQAEPVSQPAEQHRGGIAQQRPAAMSHRGGSPRIEMRADEKEKLASIIEKTLMVRGGVEQDSEIVREVRASGMHDYSAFDLGSEILRRWNVPTSGKSKREIAAIMLGRAGSHTNADFPSILANVATKSAMRGWMEAPVTWQFWANTGSLPDFKAATIAGLGGYPDLDTIPRSGGPYLEHSMDDIHETAQLATYGGLFSIGRQTLIDDDLGAFTRVPMKMGSAAARKVNALAYGELTSNPTLTQDSTALFIAGHGNFVASGSGAAPSVSTLDAGFTAMATQTSPARTGETQGDYLNISPQYLIVPKALEVTSRVLATSSWDPAGTTASVSRRDSPNPFQGRIEVVSDAILDATSTGAWYLAASRGGMVDTVTVFFLNGQQEPFLEQVDHSPGSDGVTYKVRIDAVAKALDFRGLYYNYGS